MLEVEKNHIQRIEQIHWFSEQTNGGITIYLAKL